VAFIYFFVYKRNIEHYTALVGLNPLTTYDDYGTFNGILQMDDFPYWDPTYENMGCSVKTYSDPHGEYFKKCGIQGPENVDLDSFINFDGDKVRRELIPSNYYKHLDLGNADFKTEHILVNRENPRLSAQPFQPSNIYYDARIA